MKEYEIPVLSSGQAIAVMEEFHLSDETAVRSARKFAGDLPLEVWCGIDCIFKTNHPRRDRKYEH